MGNVNREMETLRKNKKEILEKQKKNHCNRKQGLCRLNSRLDIVKKRISELADISTDISKTEMQRQKRIKNPEQNTPKL